MKIVNNPPEKHVKQLQKILDEENNGPECVGIVDLVSNVGYWHCMALENERGMATVHLGNEIYKLYVAPEYRRKHIADKLVCNVISCLKNNGETEMLVEMTKASLPFWEKFVETHQLEYEEIYGQLKVIIKLK